MAEPASAIPWSELLRPHADGHRLGVRVQPGARRDRVVARYGDRLKIQVSAPAERGRANRAVCQLVATALGIAVDSVTVVSGQTSRDKVLHIEGRDIRRRNG